jgi:DNA (cytosine-5)-methyltransferase 1
MTITVTDLFCGAGGSSSGMIQVPGVRVVMAANHWNLAIESHQANHPETDHDSADLSQVEPSRFPTTDILWASPECTNHSVAKGIKRQRDMQAQLPGLEDRLPDAAAIRSRATMWDVPRFAEYHQYKAIIIENVVDAAKWVQFPAWLLAMELLGYEHEQVWLNSMHAQALGMPAPQSRDRMYVVFWKKGNRAPDLQKWTRPKALCDRHGLISAVQAFKKAEHWGRYRAQYVYRCPRCAAVVEPGWLPASSAIDWSIPGERIGDKKKPLAEKTRKRIEKGIERYWRPLVVTAAGNTYDGITTGGSYLRARPIDDVLPTQHTTTAEAIVVPLRNHGVAKSAGHPIDTVSANGNHHALVMRNNTARGDQGQMSTPVGEPLRTLTTAGHQSLLVPYYSASEVAKQTSDPHGTLTTTDRYGLAEGFSLDVDDVLFRMLTPDEIKVGMAFARDYILLGNKSEQVKQSGNAVTPPAARDLVAAVVESLGIEVRIPA